MESEKPVAVVAAIIANLVIAAAKFVGAAMSGSSAMISEGIHSIVDTGNGFLILFGRKRAARPPDADHAFGHGKELYFWTLIVAILIFALGCGMSVYEGVTHIQQPRALENPFWSYVALAVAFVSESSSLLIAYKRFARSRLRAEFWPAVHASKDPSLFAIIFEDGAAVIGITIATLGVYLSHLLQNPYIDGAASILIGLLLGIVALLLAHECRGLLVGETVSPQTLTRIRAMVEAHPAVEDVGEILTMYLGANNVLIMMDLVFTPTLTARQVNDAIHEIETSLRERFTRTSYVSIKPVSKEYLRAG